MQQLELFEIVKPASKASSKTYDLPRRLFISYQKMKRYLIVGFLLHLMTFLGIAMSWLFYNESMQLIGEGISIRLLLYIYLSAYGASLPIFAQLDARSRYQNYKMIKDKMYRYGFSTRIIEPFTWSRCQRDAITVAARDLGYGQDMKLFLKQLGYRWYHIIPRVLLQKPTLIFSKAYWQRTLFVKHYVLKNFTY